jgi:tetratricopeptide (TPR) repeat protein
VEKVPFLIAAATVSAFTVMAQHSGGALQASGQIPLPLRLANAPVSYLRYLAKTIWPTDLCVHYPHPNLPIVGGVPWSAWQIAGAVAVLALISVLVVLLRRQRYLLMGWLWYLGMLVPTIGILQVGSQAMADRYTYLPIIGLFIAFTWGVSDAVRIFGSRLPLLRLAFAPAAAIALAVYAALSWSHLPTWRNSVTLFEQALNVAPDNIIMLNNLGNEFVERGRLEEAILQYRRSIQVAPGHLRTHELLRNALQMKAARDGAE